MTFTSPKLMSKVTSSLTEPSSYEGRGYLPPFQGSKQLRDTETKVKIEFLTTGQYPCDGNVKPIAFPDPAQVAENIGGIPYVRLTTTCTFTHPTQS